MRCIMLCWICFISSFFCRMAAQDSIAITYSDYYTSNSIKPNRLPILPKAQRVNKNSSTIVLSNSDLEEQVKKCVAYAISVWQASILNCDSIFIQVNVENIKEDIRTTVLYDMIDGTYMPRALERYKDPTKKHDTSYSDGIITINSNTIWDYSLEDNIAPNSNNLTYGIMRAIARILGFGSSVIIEDPDNYICSLKKGYSVFDGLVTNANGIRLTSINPKEGKPNEELKSYINAPEQTFWVNANSRQYQLQSPPYTVDNQPFVFLKDENSLMRSDLQVGNYMFQVDETTQAILNNLGWNTPSPSQIKIVSDDIPDTGLASAYESHRFSIEKGSLSLQNPKWEFILPLANGKTQSILLVDNNLSSTITPITNEELYKINSDGDIEGVLQFSCSINGKDVRVLPFKIHLELKPLIEYASITKIVDNSPFASYDAYYKVKYRGAEFIKVSVEEEYGSRLKTWYTKEPYIAFGIADHITFPYYAWIDFIAENKYGKSIYTIELQPYGVVSASYLSQSTSETDHHTSSIHSNSIDDSDSFEVYDVNGFKLETFNKLSDINQIRRKGLLFIKHIRSGVLLETFKRINQ